ncbi:hypothetical protein O181_013795 [Austropuccinia psidii MF-1]|uniref:Uncharacterized protein n=1 Tax=Austropuccinia psidii MF-1 TaxID=1389203 RepID=A0A9Q3BZR6_9BASI|nr:hypothetical protein [Austropuccinia psidii MF-1]
MKPWWETKIITLLVKKRNKARHQILKMKSPESKVLYYHYQESFKKNVWELKAFHWGSFLAEKGHDHAYQAYRFTKEQSTNKISALRDPEGHLITEVAEKETILFSSMSLITTDSDLDDIPTSFPTSNSLNFPPIMEYEICSIISKLPDKKSSGMDKTANELLKIAKDTIAPYLSTIFNTCLKINYFPPNGN